MKKFGLIGVIVLGLWLVQACKGKDANSNLADADSTAALKDTNTKIGVPMEKGDVEFAIKAASGGMTEVALGQLAQQRGINVRVKNFGAMMIKDHSKANAKLMAIGKAKNIALPTAPNAKDQKVIDRLSKKLGSDFDKAYVNDMIEDHKKDIKAFEYAAKNCSDADIKAFATKTLPTLKNHLDAINTIHDSMK
jgi:putative membrane protein